MSTSFSVSLVRKLIQLSQHTPFAGLGGYSPEAFGLRGDTREFPQAEREAGSFEDFFAFFSRARVEQVVRGRRLLDFGSGYGGRTVEYVRKLGAASAWGVEPVPRHIELAQRFADSLGVSGCEFRLCGNTDIPLEDSSVDVVVSYDVIEHVQDPRLSIAEIHRVLAPGGVAFLAFPLYHGAMSHHLDYITRLPGLHWFFSPETLIAAVNTLLSIEDLAKKFGTGVQPTPELSYDGTRKVLPKLNGLTGDAFLQMLSGFEIVDLRFRPIYQSRKLLGAPVRALYAMGLSGRLRDALASNLACELRKPIGNVRAS
jgi:SAM-dependent methyltransferase